MERQDTGEADMIEPQIYLLRLMVDHISNILLIKPHLLIKFIMDFRTSFETLLLLAEIWFQMKME